MSKLFNVDGLNHEVEFGKDGNILDMSNGFGRVISNSGSLINFRGADGVHAFDFVTKGQLDLVSSSSKGTVWLEYSTKPSVSNFSANTRKLFDLTQGSGSILTDYTSFPSGFSYDTNDERTSIIDTSSGTIKASTVAKQPQTISIDFTYTDLGSSTNANIGLFMDLVEFDGTSEHLLISKQFRKDNNDNGQGILTLDFTTNSTTKIIGSGKGWRLYVTSMESDSNAYVSINRIRVQFL